MTGHPSRIGKYELEEFLGGGMSHVYRARDTVLGRRVAVKVLTEAGIADEDAKARFLQEARMASNIRHENIISIYDFGEEDGKPFMVMEYLEGETLREALQRGHPAGLNDRLAICMHVGRALDYIHSRKIIHRDVKPENIHLDSSGRVKLMDFGIAKSDGVQLTRTGFTVGTPYYMAPEQVLGEPLTAQADVYAFGVLMFEVLTGQKPISAQSLDEIFHQILYDPLNVQPLEAKQVPKAVIELIQRCTAKKLIDRPRSIAQVCDQLQPLLIPTRTSQFAPKAVPPPPGLLSPSVTRASVEEVRLKMPPPPDPNGPQTTSAGRPVMSTGFFSALPAPLRSETALMWLTAIAALLVVLGLFGILSMTGVI